MLMSGWGVTCREVSRDHKERCQINILVLDAKSDLRINQVQKSNVQKHMMHLFKLFLKLGWSELSPMKKAVSALLDSKMALSASASVASVDAFAAFGWEWLVSVWWWSQCFEITHICAYWHAPQWWCSWSHSFSIAPLCHFLCRSPMSQPSSK